MAPNRFRTEILRRTSTAPLCFEIPLISKRSATTFEWKQWIPQPALFRTWKFSVRPTFGTTTRKFQAWLEVKMGEYISAAMTPQRAPSASTIRTKLLLTVSLCLSLSLSLSAVGLKGIHFSFFREKLLIPRKCREILRQLRLWAVYLNMKFRMKYIYIPKFLCFSLRGNEYLEYLYGF